VEYDLNYQQFSSKFGPHNDLSLRPLLYGNDFHPVIIKIDSIIWYLCLLHICKTVYLIWVRILSTDAVLKATPSSTGCQKCRMKWTSVVKQNSKRSDYTSKVSISCAHFVPIFWRQKLQSWNITRESCANHFCMKNTSIKCWWNWH